MKKIHAGLGMALLLLMFSAVHAAMAADIAPANAPEAEKPNIVLVLMDHFGYGELGCYGGGVTRGAATPRLDALATSGLRLTNFNVETQGMSSRASLMTGRYALRTGNARLPFDPTASYGLTQWEYTLAEMFHDAGYSTAMYGSWQLGQARGRYPTDQGFDEWWGIPHAAWQTGEALDDRIPPSEQEKIASAEILEGVKGEFAKAVKPYDLKERPALDGQLTQKAVSYINGHAKAAKPFFLFVAMTQAQRPPLPSVEFAGKTGNGAWADLLMQIDHYTGQMIDALDKNGLAERTIFIFTSSTGGDFYPGGSFAGPWRGSYLTGLEGGLRVPCIIRWPGHIPAGRASDELVHVSDLYVTLAAAAEAKVPSDRKVDGMNQLKFFTGKDQASSRQSVMVYVGDQLYAIKWRHWKAVFKEVEAGYGSPVKVYVTPVVYDLYQDPREEKPLGPGVLEQNGWIGRPLMAALADHLKTMREEPPIKPGTPDPYIPRDNAVNPSVDVGVTLRQGSAN